MMKLILLTVTMTALFGVVVAEATLTRNRSSHDRVLKKEKDEDKVDWEHFAAELLSTDAPSAQPTAVKSTQPTVSTTTAKPTFEEFVESPFSASPTQAPTPEPSKEPTLTRTKQPSDSPKPTPTLEPSKDPTLKPTEQPSITQTTGVPTTHPTSGPITPVTMVPTSSDPVITSITTTASTVVVIEDTDGGEDEFGFSFSFGDSVLTKVMLPIFRLEFVATTSMNRKLRRDELVTGDTENIFIKIISNAILTYLQGQGNLSRELVSVDLNVEDKRERHFPQTQMVIFSYDLGGSVTFVGGEDELPPLMSNELLEKVLGYLETPSFAEAVKSFNNSGMLNIDDVVVSNLNASGAASHIQKADSTGVIANSSQGGSGGAIATPVVIAFVTAFAFAIAVIGFITVRKYRQYQQNEDDNSFGQFKTSFGMLTPMAKKRQYDHFESPAGSVDSLFGDIDDNDSDYPITTCIEHGTPVSPSSYLSKEARKAIDDESDTTSEQAQNRTLDLLYSDSDSYFGSSAETSIVSAGFRPRMSSKDYVYSDTDGNSEITETESATQEEAADDSKEEHSNASENVFARLTELENQFSQEEFTTTKERLGDYKNAYNEAEDSSLAQQRNVSAGVFTEKTLCMIRRDRLRGTPPPSEGEVDGDAVDCSKGASLLGHVSDESDADDDELLFQD